MHFVDHGQVDTKNGPSCGKSYAAGSRQAAAQTPVQDYDVTCADLCFNRSEEDGYRGYCDALDIIRANPLYQPGSHQPGTRQDCPWTPPGTQQLPDCNSGSAPYCTPHGSRRETDRAPDGSLTETGDHHPSIHIGAEDYARPTADTFHDSTASLREGSTLVGSPSQGMPGQPFSRRASFSLKLAQAQLLSQGTQDYNNKTFQLQWKIVLCGVVLCRSLPRPPARVSTDDDDGGSALREH
ncbi:hypothetical protein Bbelb_415330 [Branchiostoma belcheri]|nr:hypothetical protein Bbelb_415330 [Branchiostoma belcheri]